ncbi:MAG: DUF3108 domain-containing protein [FCB group bacterium]|nr:DUF3108 domain-containing protein [FCB group bacterium]
MKYRLTISLMLCACLWGETTGFRVSLWGVQVADVTLSKRDTLFMGRSALALVISAKTVGMSSKLYPVNNRYSLIVDAATYGLRYFKKTTSQPGIMNSLETEVVQGELCYSGTDVCLPDNVFTIFSLWFYLADKQPAAFHTSNLEREGLFYTATADISREDESVIDYNLKIALNSQQSFKAVLKDTDLFSWAVFKPTARRLIRIDRKTHRISYCEFQFGLMTLSAEAKTK